MPPIVASILSTHRLRALVFSSRVQVFGSSIIVACVRFQGVILQEVATFRKPGEAKATGRTALCPKCLKRRGDFRGLAAPAPSGPRRGRGGPPPPRPRRRRAAPRAAGKHPGAPPAS